MNIWRIRRQKLISCLLSVLTGQLILLDSFWRGDLRGLGYYEISTHSHQHPSLSLSLFLFTHPFLPPFLLPLLTPAASHSPLLLSLFNLTRSSPSPAQLYSTGIEMGLSLPRTRRQGRKCQYHITVHTHPHIHSPPHTHTQKFYHKWVCFPCGGMAPLGSGRTHNSTGWSLPPPEETAPDTPGPGRSLVTPSAPPRARPTEYFHPACSPSRLCGTSILSLKYLFKHISYS